MKLFVFSKFNLKTLFIILMLSAVSLVSTIVLPARIVSAATDTIARLTAATAMPKAFQTASCPAPTFRQSREYLDFLNVSRILAGDFNRDGKKDILVNHYVGFNAVLGNGDGTFRQNIGQTLTNPSYTSFEGAAIPFSLANQIEVADFNGDGGSDLACLMNNYGGANSIIGIFVSDLNGRMSKVAEFTFATNNLTPSSIVVGDFNNDGKSDIIFSGQCCPDSSSIILSNPNGTFTASSTGWNVHTSLTVGDYNGDGNLDVITHDNYYIAFIVRLGNGKGQFTNEQTIFQGISLPLRPFFSADLNKDGKLDFFSILQGGFTAKFINDGTGKFSINGLSLQVVPGSPKVADFNGDGYPDFADEITNIITTNNLAQCGTTTIGATAANSIAIADFDNDGKADIARYTYIPSKLEVWVTSPATGANTPPTISLFPQTLSQGVNNSLPGFGSVTDTETPSSSLKLSVTNVPPGVTLTNLGYYVNDRITVDINIACTAAAGSYQIPITVTDAGGLSATANWTLNVSANQAPVLGTYPNSTVTGDFIVVQPTVSPFDLSPFTVTVSSNYAGIIQMQNDTGFPGLVNIRNNNIAGTYQATVTATDSCGLKATSSFNFTIPPTGCVQATLPKGADLNFGTSVIVPDIGQGYNGFVAGDFNGDRRNDVAVLYGSPGSSTIRLQTFLENGGLVSSGTVNAPGFGFVPNSGADFNGDGKQDVLLYDNTGGQKINIVTASFDTLGTVLESFSYVNSDQYGRATVKVGDFNKDGKADFTLSVVCCPEANFLYLSTPSGTHQKLTMNWGPYRVSEVGDFNGDGNLDVLTSDNYYPASIVRFGNGAGQFTASTFKIFNFAPFAVLDYDKDGKADLLGRAPTSAQPSLFVQVSRGNGDFAATGFANPIAPDFSYNPLFADFTGDGNLDFIDANATLFASIGLGFCQGSQLFAQSAQGRPRLAADFNGDGKADILYQSSDNKIEVWRSGGGGTANTPPRFTPNTGLTLQAGSSNYLVFFGRISDTESTAANLKVTATSTDPRLTLTRYPISVGSDQAQFFVSTNFCSIVQTSFDINLEVMDEGGLITKVVVPLQLTSNPAPLMGQYPTGIQLAVGSQITLDQGFGIYDNGSYQLTVTQPATGGGTASIDSGARVTISNPSVAGSYSVRARMTETDCGQVTERIINYTVTGGTPPTNTPPTISPAATFEGVVGASFVGITVATVNDAQTPAGALTVTATSVPAGLFVSQIANVGGMITATVASQCGASPGNKLIEFTVRDASNVTAKANFGFNVVSVETLLMPNSLSISLNQGMQLTPTLQYSGQPLTTVTVTSVVPSASFTGRIENIPFGVLITNAGPVGTHNLTVTFRDPVCQTLSTKTVVLNVTPATGCPTITFGSALNYNSNTQPYSIERADFNGDHLEDLAVINGGIDTVTIMLGQTDGSFIKQPTTYPGGAWANFVMTGDFNNDNKQDFAVTSKAANLVTIYLGAGNGTFTKKGSYPIGDKSTGGVAMKFINNKVGNARSNDNQRWAGNSYPAGK